jgi:hypothetical protein
MISSFSDFFEQVHKLRSQQPIVHLRRCELVWGFIKSEIDYLDQGLPVFPSVLERPVAVLPDIEGKPIEKVSKTIKCTILSELF